MKTLLLVCAFLIAGFGAQAQELFGSATNSSGDGYLTAGYIKNGWGAYAGVHYRESPVINTKTGTLGESMKFGILRVLPGEKFLVGVGVQPQNGVNKPNFIVGYAPLKSKGLNLWILGNIVGSKATPGLGLTYKLDKNPF